MVRNASRPGPRHPKNVVLEGETNLCVGPDVLFFGKLESITAGCHHVMVREVGASFGGTLQLTAMSRIKDDWHSPGNPAV
jgi:hypothetical protein